MTDVDYVVIGLGALGSGAAWQLASRGHSVVGLEQFELGHARGASHDTSRILRHSYHTPTYVRLTQEAYDDWARLEADSGESLVSVVGGLDLFPPDCMIRPDDYTVRDTWFTAGMRGTGSNTYLAEDVFDSDKVLDSSILGADIRDGTITSADIASLGVHTVDLDDLAVTGPKLADSAVIAGKIADGAVNGAAISDGTVDTADLRGGAVTAAKLATGSVDSSTVLDGSLNPQDLGVAGTFSLAPGAVVNATCVEQVVDVAGIAPGDHLVLTAPRDLEAGLIAMPLVPDVAGKLPLRICNFSGADVNAGQKTWNYLSI